MTATETFPADADMHAPDHSERCDEASIRTDSCAVQWVARRRANRRILPSRLPQPVRW